MSGKFHIIRNEDVGSIQLSITLRGQFSHRFGVLACWEKEHNVKTRPPSGSVAWSVGIIFTADLHADRLFPDLQNLADNKTMTGTVHFPSLEEAFQSAVVSVSMPKVVWVFVV